MIDLPKTKIALAPKPTPFVIRSEKASDDPAREALLDGCFGEKRHLRACQRLRDGRAPAAGLAFSALSRGRFVGTLRLWHIGAGDIPALMLGPLAVEASSRRIGVGTALMDRALATAEARGHRAVILLGDEPYYARFGFAAKTAAGLVLPGPFERDRLLGLEFEPGALDGACGLIIPTGPAATSASERRRALRARAA